MQVINTQIEDVKVIIPALFGDERGFFMETWRQDIFNDRVANREFVQDNHSRSQRGVLRGLHYQTEQTQGKLIRVISGKIFDVAVDMRKDSTTFGHWVGQVLSEENRRQLWIPEGFAHGFYVMSDIAECVYKCTDYYHSESEVSLCWNDPSLNINWPFSDAPLLSEKDKKGVSFEKAPFFI
ncbi:dTDP-4-dehydrorhamnose 3,5-epimerase [uncultured Shewanella sp.]|uniref:dTDP-4-dehydrorhamnose 3,5-epimerase n=1 Tax=uncultured Shewanella sp. TaxID=173975 RepID=UPI00260BE1E5|nr:dTDP-4-dehydrorhamnose 3,5-epimerase [uncultured Shewanella sp.]